LLHSLPYIVKESKLDAFIKRLEGLHERMQSDEGFLLGAVAIERARVAAERKAAALDAAALRKKRAARLKRLRAQRARRAPKKR